MGTDHKGMCEIYDNNYITPEKDNFCVFFN